MSIGRTSRADPRNADWYACVVYGRDDEGGSETDYNDGYFVGDKPTQAFARQKMVPVGYRILEFNVRKVQ